MKTDVNKIAQTYVWHNGRCYFVSTINRVSSAIQASDQVYAETLVFEMNGSEVGKIVDQFGAAQNTIWGHIRMVEKVFMGKAGQEDDEL